VATTARAQKKKTMAFNMNGSKFYGGGNQSKKSALKAKETEAEFLARMKREGQTVKDSTTVTAKDTNRDELAKIAMSNKSNPGGGGGTPGSTDYRDADTRLAKGGDKDAENRLKDRKKIIAYANANNVSMKEAYQALNETPAKMKKAPMKKEDPSAGIRAKNKAEIDASAKAINERRGAYAKKLAIARRKKTGKK
jgi:hypothetical protein